MEAQQIEWPMRSMGFDACKAQTLQSLPKHKSLPFQTQLLICHMAGVKMKMKMTCFLKMAQEPFWKNQHEKGCGNGDENGLKMSTLNPPISPNHKPELRELHLAGSVHVQTRFKL